MITTGNLGQSQRLTIGPDGSISMPGKSAGVDGGSRLHWYVAADDRWHVPADEPSVRQTRIAGTPVTETRVRVPQGDVVQRVFTTAVGGGVTVIEVENESPLAVAVAFDRPDLLTERPISRTPIEGISLPEGSFVLPLGHAASLRVGIAHAAGGPGPLPQVPEFIRVVDGWLDIANRAGRVVLPEASAAWAESVTTARCDSALGVYDDVDPASYLINLDQLVRMNLLQGAADLDAWLLELVASVEALGPDRSWLAGAALRAGQRVLRSADEDRALRDLTKILARRGDAERPDERPTGLAVIPWVEEALVVDGRLLPGGIPADWVGQSFEAHGLPSAVDSTVSYAVRWHGPRPAVLWEQTGDIRLSSPSVDPAWSSDRSAGEALWAAQSDGGSP